MSHVTDIEDVFRQTDHEVWLLTSADGGERAGLIATFVHQASIVPELRASSSVWRSSTTPGRSSSAVAALCCTC